MIHAGKFIKLFWRHCAELLLLLAIFLLPWQTRWIFHAETLTGYPYEYGSRSIYGVDIVIIAACIIGLLTWNAQNQARFRKYQTLFLSTITFWLACYLSFFFALDKSMSGWWLGNLGFGMVFCWILIWKEVSWKRAAWAFVSAMTIQALLGLIQWKLQIIPPSTYLGIAQQLPEIPGTQVIDTLPFGRVLRAYGSFPHPNIFALYLSLGITLATALLHTHIDTPARNRRLWLLGVIGLGTIIAIQSAGLWVAASRSSIIALGIVGISLALWHALEYRRPHSALIIAAASIALPFVILTAACPWYVSPRIDGISNVAAIADTNNTVDSARLERKSVAERYTNTSVALDTIQTHYLTGIGIGNSTTITREPVHNVWLLIFQETGIFGMFAATLFATTLAWTIASQYRATAKHSRSEAALYASTGMLSILVISSLFDHFLWSLHPGILLVWLCIAFSFLAVDEA